MVSFESPEKARKLAHFVLEASGSKKQQRAVLGNCIATNFHFSIVLGYQSSESRNSPEILSMYAYLQASISIEMQPLN